MQRSLHSTWVSVEQLFAVESAHMWLKESKYAYINDFFFLSLEVILLDLAPHIEYSRLKLCVAVFILFVRILGLYFETGDDRFLQNF